jgi:hypothetical protein
VQIDDQKMVADGILLDGAEPFADLIERALIQTAGKREGRGSLTAAA